VSLTSKAIVISRESFGEADKYVQFLTQQWGVISVLAKSARKSKRRYVGGLDLFCHDEIFVRGDPHKKPYLLELTVLNSFTGLRDRYEKLIAAGKAVQWIKKLANLSTPLPNIYSLLGQTLALMEKENEETRLDLINLIFRMKLLSQLGFKPRVQSCTRCEKALEPFTFFDMQAGGSLCLACSQGRSLTEALELNEEERTFLHDAEHFKFSQWPLLQFSPNKTNKLTHLVTQFASYHTHVKLLV